MTANPDLSSSDIETLECPTSDDDLSQFYLVNLRSVKPLSRNFGIQTYSTGIKFRILLTFLDVFYFVLMYLIINIVLQ